MLYCQNCSWKRIHQVDDSKMRVLWWTFGQTSSQRINGSLLKGVITVESGDAKYCNSLVDCLYVVGTIVDVMKMGCWLIGNLTKTETLLNNTKSGLCILAVIVIHHLLSVRQFQPICISLTFFIFNCMVAPSSKAPRCVIEIFEHHIQK